MKFNRERLLKLTSDPRYLRVGLHLNGKHKLEGVHRVVAKAFIPNPLNLPDINHIDSNKQNNMVSNLEWTNAKMNAIHRNKSGNGNTLYGENQPRTKISDRDVKLLREMYNTGEFTQRDLGKLFNIAGSQVHRILHFVDRKYITGERPSLD